MSLGNGGSGHFAPQKWYAVDVAYGSKADMAALNPMSAVPPIADMERSVSDVRQVPRVLKKSDFTSDQNLAEALVRSSQIYVGDRIANPISNGRPPQALHKVLH